MVRRESCWRPFFENGGLLLIYVHGIGWMEFLLFRLTLEGVKIINLAIWVPTCRCSWVVNPNPMHSSSHFIPPPPRQSYSPPECAHISFTPSSNTTDRSIQTRQTDKRTNKCAPKIHIETIILYVFDWFIHWSCVYVFECSLNTSLFEFDACYVGSFCACNVCSCCVLCRARKPRKKPLQVRNLRDFDQFI